MTGRMKSCSPSEVPPRPLVMLVRVLMMMERSMEQLWPPDSSHRVGRAWRSVGMCGWMPGPTRSISKEILLSTFIFVSTSLAPCSNSNRKLVQLDKYC